MNDVSKEAKAKVAAFVEKHVNRSKYSQKEIAEICGFNTPNIITMIKQGMTKVPIEKIPKLAQALDIDRVEFFDFVMRSYKPKEYEAILEIIGEPITEAEHKVIRLLRRHIPEGDLINRTDHYLDKIREAITT
ncbi:helix-turn-helix domain-containing protein [Methylomonas sp. ZR1]|uniref:helix-turn-helix domain-containing protein n=1 Tax=Methylomonas sp. ZR1 TaxID=1797072 RepID=UPI001490AA80|nr:helix-turn-helix transcriptional regulator [Methylomonas sp. ZR1]NOV31220.1 XRE family transcriptional regulator [Methylomonas sp. ZR1]